MLANTNPRITWLSGDVGSGKTRLLRRLERSARTSSRGCIYVPIPTLDLESLTIWCLAELGLEREGGPAALEIAARDRLCVLVDDAEGLPDESAEMLSGLASQEDGQVRVLCAGAEEPPEGLAPGQRLTLEGNADEVYALCHAALGLGSESSSSVSEEESLRPSQVSEEIAAHGALVLPNTVATDAPVLPIAVATDARVLPSAVATAPGVVVPIAPEVARPSLAARATRSPWPTRMLAMLAGAAVAALALLVGPLAVEFRPAAERTQPVVAPQAPLAASDGAPADPSQALPKLAPAEESDSPVPSEEAIGPVAGSPAPAPAETPPRPEPVTTPRTAPEARSPLPAVSAAPGARSPLPSVSPAPVVREAPRTRVIVNAVPPAVVRVDDRVVGGTPIAALELEPGRHLMNAEFEDGTRVEREVDVQGDVLLILFP